MAGTLTTHEHATKQAVRPANGGSAPVAADQTTKAGGNGRNGVPIRFRRPAGPSTDPVAGAFDNVRRRPAMRFGGGS